ncbi:unnamed protein product [Ascophyllum nodosum]
MEVIRDAAEKDGSFKDEEGSERRYAQHREEHAFINYSLMSTTCRESKVTTANSSFSEPPAPSEASTAALRVVAQIPPIVRTKERDPKNAAGNILRKDRSSDGVKRNSSGAARTQSAEEPIMMAGRREEFHRGGTTVPPISVYSSNSCSNNSRKNCSNDVQGAKRMVAEQSPRGAGPLGEEKKSTKLRDQEKLRDQLMKLVSLKLSLAGGGEMDHAGMVALEALAKMPPPPEISPSHANSPTESINSNRTHASSVREKQHLPPGVQNLPKFGGKDPAALTDILNRFHALVVHALPGSNEEQINRALLRDLVFVLEGHALNFYKDLKSGRVEWEPTPPNEALESQATGGSTSIRPPSTWVEICNAMHDHFLPAHGIARTSRALLNLRQAPGESIPELARRQVGLCHHLNRLVDANGGRTTYWDAISMALFEQALRTDLRRAHEAEPPCSSFQESVNRAERNYAEATGNAFIKQRSSAEPEATAAPTATPPTSVATSSAAVPVTSSVAAAATTRIVDAAPFAAGEKEVLDGKKNEEEQHHHQTSLPVEAKQAHSSSTPSSFEGAGGLKVESHDTPVGSGVVEASGNRDSTRGSRSSSNGGRGDKKRPSTCPGKRKDFVAVKCEAAAAAGGRRKVFKARHHGGDPSTRKSPFTPRRGAASVKSNSYSSSNSTQGQKRDNFFPRVDDGQSASGHSGHQDLNKLGESTVTRGESTASFSTQGQKRDNFFPRVDDGQSASGHPGHQDLNKLGESTVTRGESTASFPQDNITQAPASWPSRVQSPFDNVGGQGQGGGKTEGGGYVLNQTDQHQALRGVTKNVRKIPQHQKKNVWESQGGWAGKDYLSRRQPELEETRAEDRPPCSYPHCRAINRNSHSARDCRFRLRTSTSYDRQFDHRVYQNPRSADGYAAERPMLNPVSEVREGYQGWKTYDAAIGHKINYS